MQKPQTTTLVQPLEDEVSRLGGRVRQVKQKFGRLCFFYSLPRSVSEPNRQALARTVKQAEEMSVRICETCGSPGELSNDDGIYLTRCGACFETRRHSSPHK